MLDCSDGLALDCRRLAVASGVTAVVHLELVPVAPDAATLAERSGRDADILAATGGDDYELIVCLGSGTTPPVLDGVALTRIGEVIVGEAGLRLLRAGEPVVPTQPRLGARHRLKTRIRVRSRPAPLRRLRRSDFAPP